MYKQALACIYKQTIVRNYENFKLSIKSSDIFMAVESYEKISDLIEQPLHLGITESGSLKTGTVKSKQYIPTGNTKFKYKTSKWN